MPKMVILLIVELLPLNLSTKTNQNKNNDCSEKIGFHNIN